MCVFWRKLLAFVALPEGESMEDTWDSEGNEKSLMYILAPEEVNPIAAWFRIDSSLLDAACERHSPHLQSVKVCLCHTSQAGGLPSGISVSTQRCLLFNDLTFVCQSKDYHGHGLM